MNPRRALQAITACMLAAWVSAAGAAIVTYDFAYVYDTGPRTGISGAGFVTYDDALLTGTGAEALNGPQGTTITVTDFGGQIDTILFFPSDPTLLFNDGVLVNVTASFVRPGMVACCGGLLGPGEGNWGLRTNTTIEARDHAAGVGDYVQSFGTYTLTLRTNAVPEPPAAALVALALVAAGCVRRRRPA